MAFQLVDAQQSLGFVATLRVAQKLQGDLLAMGPFFQNDFEPVKLMTMQPSPNILLRLRDDRFLEGMHFKANFDSHHGACLATQICFAKVFSRRADSASFWN